MPHIGMVSDLIEDVSYDIKKKKAKDIKGWGSLKKTLVCGPAFDRTPEGER